MGTPIAAWGNSEAVRIPREMLRLVGLRRGDRVGFEVNAQGRLEIVPEKEVHRNVVPARGVTFDGLFKGYKNPAPDGETAWPNEDMVGAERDSWSR